MINCGRNDLSKLINMIYIIGNNIKYNLLSNYRANIAEKFIFYFSYK